MPRDLSGLWRVCPPLNLSIPSRSYYFHCYASLLPASRDSKNRTTHLLVHFISHHYLCTPMICHVISTILGHVTLLVQSMDYDACCDEAAHLYYFCSTPGSSCLESHWNRDTVTLHNLPSPQGSRATCWEGGGGGVRGQFSLGPTFLGGALPKRDRNTLIKQSLKQRSGRHSVDYTEMNC